MEPLITPEELSAYLRVKTSTLAQWRYRGTGPAFQRPGGHVRYRRADVDKWLRENAVDDAAS